MHAYHLLISVVEPESQGREAMLWFVSGIVTFAILLGFLVGASESPVVGTAVTAAFGLLAGVVSLLATSSSKAEGSSPSKRFAVELIASRSALSRLGKVLLAFAIPFGCGVAAGASSRIVYSNPVQSTMPWHSLKPPLSPTKALDWIVVRERLRDLGYTDQQVQSLYQIELDANLRESKERGREYQSDDLLAPIFAGAPRQKPFLIANQPKGAFSPS
jgi:hypothetical protein